MSSARSLVAVAMTATRAVGPLRLHQRSLKVFGGSVLPQLSPPLHLSPRLSEGGLGSQLRAAEGRPGDPGGQRGFHEEPWAQGRRAPHRRGLQDHREGPRGLPGDRLQRGAIAGSGGGERRSRTTREEETGDVCCYKRHNSFQRTQRRTTDCSQKHDGSSEGRRRRTDVGSTKNLSDQGSLKNHYLKGFFK